MSPPKKRRRRSSPNRRATSVASVKRQLRALRRRLKAEYPELLAVGLGERRRAGRCVPETTIKLIVERKYRPMPRGGKKLPLELPLEKLVFGQRVRVMVPVDVENPEEAVPTRFQVGRMRASALAVWSTDAGAAKVGVVTAGHGLLDAPGGAVRVQTRLGDKDGQVVAVSDFRRTQIDVGLVAINVARRNLFDIGGLSPPLATSEQLLDFLGRSRSDRQTIDAVTWKSTRELRIKGLAFYERYPFKDSNKKTRILRDAVFCEADVARFRRGTSGSTWVTIGLEPENVVMALQSHGLRSFKAGFGNCFGTAVDWLKRQPNINGLRVSWRVADI